ncbi:MAG: hypothetical protein A3K03_04210 [Bdellovibrionales bacterium RIFOXYD1_FULL_44_7]|nr:MAG: hypothetical protein A3K03_04210 [Bdellovibrionales bacterium RIFOXYD1_FULL_44_7]
MSDLGESIKKFPLGLLLALYLGYVGFDLYSFINMDDSPLLQKKAVLAGLKKSNIELQRKIQTSQEFYKNLDAKKVELRQMAQKLDEMKGTLTEEMDTAGFVKMVITEAKKVGMTVQSLKPKGSRPKELYVEHSFDLTFKAVFVQLVVFLERLSNLQKIVRIERFSLRPVTASSARFVELEGIIELNSYTYISSKADEIGKGAPQGGGP